MPARTKHCTNTTVGLLTLCPPPGSVTLADVPPSTSCWVGVPNRVVEVATGVAVTVELVLDVGVGLAVAVGLALAVMFALEVGLGLGIALTLEVGLGMGVRVALAVGLALEVAFAVLVGLALAVGLLLDAGLALAVGLITGVFVGVGVGALMELSATTIPESQLSVAEQVMVCEGCVPAVPAVRPAIA